MIYKLVSATSGLSYVAHILRIVFGPVPKVCGQAYCIGCYPYPHIKHIPITAFVKAASYPALHRPSTDTRCIFQPTVRVRRSNLNLDLVYIYNAYMTSHSNMEATLVRSAVKNIFYKMWQFIYRPSRGARKANGLNEGLSQLPDV